MYCNFLMHIGTHFQRISYLYRVTLSNHPPVPTCCKECWHPRALGSALANRQNRREFCVYSETIRTGRNTLENKIHQPSSNPILFASISLPSVVSVTAQGDNDQDSSTMSTQFTPEYLAFDEGPEAIRAMSAILGITTVVIALRFGLRIFRKVRLGIEDWSMIFALVSLLIWSLSRPYTRREYIPLLTLYCAAAFGLGSRCSRCLRHIIRRVRQTLERCNIHGSYIPYPEDG